MRTAAVWAAAVRMVSGTGVGLTSAGAERQALRMRDKVRRVRRRGENLEGIRGNS
jgi:hypothetical protein